MKNLRIFNIIFLILMLNLKIYSQFNVNMSNQENIETSGPKVTDEVLQKLMLFCRRKLIM